uniref:contactin-5-like n=1 Tax=Pristiophorus japonicus TaxID=55135 RepID=UPI00398F7BE4
LSLCLSLSLSRGPEFILEPQEHIVLAEAETRKVTLTCEARGNPKPNYRWFRNGTVLELGVSPRYSQVGGSLIIDGPTEASDTGTYYCLTSNSIGSLLSREGHLRFARLGNFSEHTRGTVSVREGQGVVLMCSPPSHTTVVRYGWVFNVFPTFVEEDSRRFISQATGNLYIAKAQPSDVGSYICLLKDMVTRRRVLSPPTPLTLRTDGAMGEYEPKIEVHFPPVLEVPQGSTANLECFALGNPVPTITWRKVDGNLPSRARLRKSQAVLEVLNVQSGDAGVYECRVENTRGGNVIRGLLQVYTRPHWIQTINDTKLDSGQELRWECRAVARPRPNYRWLKDGKALTSQARVAVSNGLLTIAGVKRSDAGMYQCVAENQHGSALANAELQILASAPNFNVSPVESETLVCVAQDLLLECKPQSSPKASISWMKNERPLREAERVTISEGGTLRLSNVTRADTGSYTCRAQNVFGVSFSSGTVYVKDATEVKLAPSRMEASVGESVVLTCRAHHDLTLQLHFLWFHNGRNIDFHSRGGHFESIRAHTFSSDLMIRNIQLTHAGRYSCGGRTLVDSSSDTAELLVR